MLRLLVISFVLSISIVSFGQQYRAFDGFGNNIQNPDWGSSGTQLIHMVSNGYEDGFGKPGGKFRPNARVISNELFNQEISIPGTLGLSDFVWVFGQFIDHDINLVKKDFQDTIFVKIPSNDQYFSPGSYLQIMRSLPSFGTGTDTSNPRRHSNEISSFIDASNIYGSDEIRASWLRTFNGGKLKTSKGNLLPWNTLDSEFNGKKDADAPSMADDIGLSKKLFVSGDVRANENPLLASMHILFVREHNRLCDELKNDHPLWNDELIFQRARKMLGALIQSIVYYEWLPAMGIVLPDYQAYDEDINPGIYNVFTAAAFRLGHSLLNDSIIRVDYSGDMVGQGYVKLKDAFFNPTLIVLTGGIEPFVTGMAVQNQQKLDCKMLNGVRNFLFGEPGQGGLDLVAINIIRGREHGLPDYNKIRADFGLEKYGSIEMISDDDKLVSDLKFLYGNVDNIDPWVGMLAEDQLENKMFGELLLNILKQQFTNLRDGDRYYFENDPVFKPVEIELIKSTRLRDIILRNTGIKKLQENVFKVSDKVEQNPGPDLVNVHLDAVAYPNPVVNQLNIKFYSIGNSDILITVMNPLGQRIKLRHFAAVKGENVVGISIDKNFPPGIYNIMIESGDSFAILRIIKK